MCPWSWGWFGMAWTTPTTAPRYVYDADGNAILDANGQPTTVEAGFLGVLPTQVIVRQDLTYGLARTGQTLEATGKALVHLPQLSYHAARVALGLEARDSNGLVSIIGVGRIAGEISAADVTGYTLGARIADLLGLVAMLNLALFMFNMIPLLPLDGGHIAGAFWQAIKDGWAKAKRLPRPHPVDLARTMPATYLMFVVLMGLGLLLMYVDIVNPISLG
jgi:membrane-associated protease RseP (regulator of RpoE activity)